MIIVRRGRPRDRARHAQEFNELVRTLMLPRGTRGGNGTGPWRPPVDVYETPGTITIVAEVAGMERESFEVVIEGDVVSIRGHRADPNVCDNRAFHEAHIAYGDFAADVYVATSVDVERATATYENGFLNIVLPRVQGRTIIPTAPTIAAGNERSDA
jgi:HSP20 family molecular chaperone IbpA